MKTTRVIATVFWLATVGALLMAIVWPSIWRTAEVKHLRRRAAAVMTVGDAIDAYAFEHNFYPLAATCNDLRTMLVPKYAAAIPCEDGAGGRIVYVYVSETCPQHKSGCKPGEQVATRYVVISTGRDGEFDERSKTLIHARKSVAAFGAAFDPIAKAGRRLSWYDYVDADIIYTGGNFLTGPDEASSDITGGSRPESRYWKKWGSLSALCGFVALVLDVLWRRMRRRRGDLIQ